MATYYGRAAGGNWNTAATWSLTSGGGATGSVPTSADNVILDANSGNITLDGTTGSPNLCADLTCTGYTGTLTASATTVLSIYGSLLFVAGMTYTTNNSAIFNFLSTATGKTINSGGKVLPNLVFNGAGGAWTQTSAVTMRGFTLTQGSYDTGNLAMTVSANGINASGTLTRSLTLGSSTVTFGGGTVDFTDTTNLTFNAGTSTLTDAGLGTNGFNLIANNMTFHIVNSVISIQGGGNTFYELSIFRHSGGGRGTLTLHGDQTVTNLFYPGGYQAVGQGSRLWVRSNDPTVRRTITCNGTVTVNKTDFDGIIGAGTASWDMTDPAVCINGFAGTTGNNSGIIFTPAMNLYWVHGASASIAFSTAANWMTTSGGSTSAGRYPLLQDTAIFDGNSFGTTGKTVSGIQGDLTNLDMTGVTNAPKFTLSGTSTAYGDILLSAGMTLTGAPTITFRGYGTKTFAQNGCTLPVFITVINNPVGTLVFSGTTALAATVTQTMGTITSTSPFSVVGNLTLTAGLIDMDSTVSATGSITCNGGIFDAYGASSGSNFVCAAASVYIGAGGLTTGGQLSLSNALSAVTINGTTACTGNIVHGIGALTFNDDVTCPIYTASSSSARSLTMLPGKSMTCTSTGTVFNIGTSTGMTLNIAGATIILSNTSVTTKTFAGGGLSYPTVQINGASGAGVVAFTGNNTIDKLTAQPNANITVASGSTTTITKPLELIGTAGNTVKLRSSSASVSATIICPNGLVNCDYITVRRIAANGNVPFYAGANSVDEGNNTNWLFQAPVGLVKVWDSAAGVWKEKAARRWNGTAWEMKPVKHYNGSSFVAS